MVASLCLRPWAGWPLTWGKRFVREARHNNLTSSNRLHFPGESFDFSSADAHNPAVAAGYMTAMFMFIFPIEGLSLVALAQNKAGRAPGSYNFDPLNLYGKDDKSKQLMREKEVVHSRLAMLAFSGIATQAALTGHSFPYF